MKTRTLFTAMVILFTLSLFSQTNEFDCYSTMDTLPDAPGMYSYSTQFVKATNPHMVLNVKFWKLRKDDGFANTIVTEQEALEATANLNISFNEYNIFFKFRGFEYVDDNVSYYETSIGVLKARFTELSLETDNSMNVILHEVFPSGMANCPGYFCFVPAPLITETVTIHEIGHNLGLRHTCEKYTYGCEHVTREEFLPNGDPNPAFNAKTNGDYVVDTAAICPATSDYNYDYNICDFTQQGYDCQDPPEAYDLDIVDLLNYMNVNDPNSVYTCRTMFSTGQGVRMRETILGRPDIFVAVSATVQDLYEPYFGEYKYCNGNEIHNPKFQPGFNYEFIECRLFDVNLQNCPTPFGYQGFILGPNSYPEFDSYESYDSSYNLPIVHPNHTAIYIADLNDHPNKCYDAWRNASGGSVKNFLDGVINYNYTIQSLDSLQINSPDLVPNLQNGLYNIEKNYNDGSIEQETILKDD